MSGIRRPDVQQHGQKHLTTQETKAMTVKRQTRAVIVTRSHWRRHTPGVFDGDMSQTKNRLGQSELKKHSPGETNGRVPGCLCGEFDETPFYKFCNTSQFYKANSTLC